MNDRQAAQEILAVVKLLAKKEVPEAFKKQWKDKDKNNDGKENEPKPDFLKDKKDKKDKKAAQELVSAAKELTAGDIFREMRNALKDMNKALRPGADREVDKYDAINALARISRAFVKIEKSTKMRLVRNPEGWD